MAPYWDSLWVLEGFIEGFYEGASRGCFKMLQGSVRVSHIDYRKTLLESTPWV